MDDIKHVIDCGVEKVVINTSAYENPRLLEEGAKIFGSQSIIVSVDVKKDWLGRQYAYVNSGKKRVHYSLIDYIKKIQEFGAGEIILTSIDREGTFSGYDYELIQKLTPNCNIPIVANGGAHNVEDFRLAVEAGASAVAAGSSFVYTGREHGIMINYPKQEVLRRELYEKL